MAQEVAVLPLASVTTVAKRALSSVNAQLSKDAKTTLSTAAAIFICYLTSAVKAGGSINVNAKDIAIALEELDLSEFNEQIHAALEAFREEKGAKRAVKRPRLEGRTGGEGVEEERGGEERAGEERGGEEKDEDSADDLAEEGDVSSDDSDEEDVEDANGDDGEDKNEGDEGIEADANEADHQEEEADNADMQQHEEGAVDNGNAT